MRPGLRPAGHLRVARDRASDRLDLMGGPSTRWLSTQIRLLVSLRPAEVGAPLIA